MGTFLRKLYTKNEKKLSGSFWEIDILSEKLTTTTTWHTMRASCPLSPTLLLDLCLEATALTGIRSQFLRTQWRAIISEWTRLCLRPLSHRGWLLNDGTNELWGDKVDWISVKAIFRVVKVGFVYFHIVFYIILIQ